MSNQLIELVVHPLCPYAQRALYTSSIKQVPLSITEVSLANPPDWFLELNPLGEVPSCRVTRDGQVFKLTESLNISEFLDSFPGPALYPRLESGEKDPVAKCLIDVFISHKVQRFAGAFYGAVYSSEQSDEEKKEIQEAFLLINSFVEGGFAMHKILNKNELTFADVMLLPHVERLSAFRDQLPEFVKALDLTHLWKWFELVTALEWTTQHRASISRLKKSLQIYKSGEYKGLDLPVTLYDE
jgi:glutathione S-transferase